jgi:hypothetical protein
MLGTLARLKEKEPKGFDGALREIHRYGILEAAARKPSEWRPNGGGGLLPETAKNRTLVPS